LDLKKRKKTFFLNYDCKRLKLMYMFITMPWDVTHITITDTPTRCPGWKFTNNL